MSNSAEFINRRSFGPSVPDRWLPDPTACRLQLAFPDGRFVSTTLDDLHGWVELNEAELQDSQLLLHFRTSVEGEQGQSLSEVWSFRGPASGVSEEGGIEFEGRLRRDDLVDPVLLVLTPTLYQQRGEREFLDLDLEGALTPTRCGAIRVEGRLRIFRARPAA